MLSEVQKSKFTKRAKDEAQKLLRNLNIEKFISTDDTGRLIEQLDCEVSGLVSQKECEHQKIDEELLDIYDLLTDIVLDNEENLDFLNELFFD